MVATTVSLRPEQIHALRAVALRTGIPMARLVREFIRAGLAGEAPAQWAIDAVAKRDEPQEGGGDDA